MQNYPDTLGDVLKASRIRSELDIDAVAEKVGISTRYLYRIENEYKKLSYDVLCKLIRTVSAPVDQIFYPQKADSDPEMDEMIHMLHKCDKQSLKIVRATLQATLSTQKAEIKEKYRADND